jgi:hypothetical protein
LDLKWFFDFLSGQQSNGIGGGLFMVPTSKELFGRVFTGLVRWNSLEAGLGARIG